MGVLDGGEQGTEHEEDLGGQDQPGETGDFVDLSGVESSDPAVDQLDQGFGREHGQSGEGHDEQCDRSKDRRKGTPCTAGIVACQMAADDRDERYGQETARQQVIEVVGDQEGGFVCVTLRRVTQPVGQNDVAQQPGQPRYEHTASHEDGCPAHAAPERPWLGHGAAALSSSRTSIGMFNQPRPVPSASPSL